MSGAHHIPATDQSTEPAVDLYRLHAPISAILSAAWDAISFLRWKD
jgi:hypothetical protein